jgi:hypothetical protein
VQRSRSGRTGTCAGSVPAPLAFLRAAPAGSIRGLALATMTCLLLAGCSPGADFPALFPAVHDTPPPRTDPTMSPLELQKATENLISERDRLNAQAPQNPQGKNPANTAKDKVTGSVTTAKIAKGAPRQAVDAPPATTASAQGAGVQAAGADPKP